MVPARELVPGVMAIIDGRRSLIRNVVHRGAAVRVRCWGCGWRVIPGDQPVIVG